jgi:nitrogen regulatory protein PII
MKYQHEVIFCIVNEGFSDAVMDAARQFGARGGTVIHARGTANKEAEKLFKVAVQPEKEIVMILVPAEIKNDVLKALYRAVGLDTPGQGIAFSMPVDDAVGLPNTEATEVKKDPS